jgi:hypothetical protein
MPDVSRDLLVRADSYLSLLWYRPSTPHDTELSVEIPKVVAELRAAYAGGPQPPQKDYPHRCSGCGLRWHTTMPGSVAAELCGACWRKVQPILHGGDPAQEQP